MSTLTSRRPLALVRLAAALVLVVAGFAMPLMTSSPYDLGRFEVIFIYVLGAISLNFAFGYGGQLVIAQPFLIMIAAYVSAIATTRYEWGILVAALLGILAAVVSNVVLGLPSLRVRGWYLAIIGLLAVGIIPSLAQALSSVTNGDDGISGIPPIGFGDWIATPGQVYEIIFVCTVLCWIGMRNLVKSGWGIRLHVTRDHPVAAAACGVDTMKMRAWVYVLSAIPCGVAGVLFAHSQQYVSSSSFDTSTVMLLIGSVFLGGPGTLWGVVVGVAVFEGLVLYLGEFSPYNPLIYGLGVLFAALIFRGGIIRSLETLSERLFMSKSRAVRLSPSDECREFLSPIEPQFFSVTGVAKHFGGNRVLNGISLELTGGEVVGVVGPNGSGKTTFLNVLGGFVRADEGSVTIDGRDVTGQSAFRRAREGIGRTFQVPKTVAGMTILESVETGVAHAPKASVMRALFRLFGFRQAENSRREVARRACHAVGFRDVDLDLKIGVLPLGLRRMVEIARVLAGEAALICLDESVAGLDAEEQAQVARIARALAESGRAVLLIEHNLPFVREVCDRIVLLENGSLADSGASDAVDDMSRPLGQFFNTFEPSGSEERV